MCVYTGRDVWMAAPGQGRGFIVFLLEDTAWDWIWEQELKKGPGCFSYVPLFSIIDTLLALLISYGRAVYSGRSHTPPRNVLHEEFSLRFD